MMRLIAALFLLAANAAAAEVWPSLMNVINVSPEDHLNIRKEPSATAPIIGRLAPDEKGLEVVGASENGKWGLLNFEDTAGWVSLNYMQQITVQKTVPSQLFCVGTEPFWTTTFDNMTVVFSSPDTENISQEFVTWTRSANAQGRYSADLASGTAFLTRNICSDGMSDRAYGFMLDLVLRSDAGDTHYTGCCALQP